MQNDWKVGRKSNSRKHLWLGYFANFNTQSMNSGALGDVRSPAMLDALFEVLGLKEKENEDSETEQQRWPL